VIGACSGGDRDRRREERDGWGHARGVLVTIYEPARRRLRMMTVSGAPRAQRATQPPASTRSPS
jgi:hypothetical protein